MGDNHVAPSVVLRVLNHHKVRSTFKDGILTYWPNREGATPEALPVEEEGLKSRLVIRVGARCGIPPFEFWHPAELVPDHAMVEQLSEMAPEDSN